MNNVLDDALQLVAQGYAVFPCGMHKRPSCPHGFLDAATDARVVEDLWQSHPGELIGVPTGISFRFDCLDIDAKHELAHAWWNRHRHDIPPTRVHRTRSGGLHLLFSANTAMRCSAGRLAPGVDTRGRGGYVIWWPSAGYPVLRDIPLAPWPEWLLKEFAPKPQPPKPKNGHFSLRGDAWLRGLTRTVASAAEGQRNSVLFWLKLPRRLALTCHPRLLPALTW